MANSHSTTPLCPGTAASAAATRPSTASTRPGSAVKRPGTAKKFSTAELLKSASGLFSVFERNKAQEEVRRLEDDVKGVEKVQAKLAKVSPARVKRHLLTYAPLRSAGAL